MFAFIWKLLGRFFFAGYVGNQNAFPKPLSPAEEEASRNKRRHPSSAWKSGAKNGKPPGKS